MELEPIVLKSYRTILGWKSNGNPVDQARLLKRNPAWSTWEAVEEEEELCTWKLRESCPYGLALEEKVVHLECQDVT